MPSNTKNVKLGACTVTYGGVDLGYTKGGVKMTVKTSTKKVQSDQFGSVPINEYITNREVSVTAPLSESTIENISRVVVGATLVKTGGVKATGTITFVTAPPVAGDTVVINGVTFTFKAAPADAYDVGIGTTIAASAANLAAVINGTVDQLITGYLVASVNGAAVSLTAIDTGTAYNAVTLAKTFATPASCTVSGATLAGGVDHTKSKVSVPTGIGQSLIDNAKVLILHPVANAASDRSGDVTIPIAGVSGDTDYAFEVENERVFNTTFTAYPDPVTKLLYVIGDTTAS